MRAPLLVILLPGFISAALAQAPRITPSGDPSVQTDTIYRLAVNPADYPDQSFVYLLDDGVVRFEADGRGSRTYRQVVQVLTEEGAERWGEQTFSYVRGRERLTVNWIRVVRPNGEVISAQPTHEQESLAPVALQAPVYSDSRVRRVTLGGVTPGTLVDYSFTIERLQPILPGDFYAGWSVTTGRPTRRSRYVVDLPATSAPRIQEHNVRFPRRVVEGHGRRVYTWATAEVPKLESEPFAASPNSVFVSIDLAGVVTWGDVARWYARLSADRYEVTPELEARFREVVARAATRDDSLRALHRWVAQDFRYVALSLGLGGYQPRPPAAVLETRYGDCKDKATLFIALVRRMGAVAYPVLLSSSGGADSTLPSLSQFDHMIAALQRPGGYVYLDLTSELTPFGELPPAEQGSFALIVHPDGSGEQVSLPADSARANRQQSRVVGALSRDGVFSGRFTEAASGAEQYALREAFSRSFAPKELRELTRNTANAPFDGATGDSLEIFDGRDLRAEPRVTLLVRGARITTASGDADILPLPLRSYVSAALVAEVEAHVPRKYPIDIGAVIGPLTQVGDFEVTLPEGWRAKLPPSVHEASAFGSYATEYAQEGRVLHVTRRMSGYRGVAPPDQVSALIAWLRAVSKDDARYLVLEHAK